MSFEDHVAGCVVRVLLAVPARLRDDVQMVGVWITAERTAIVGWNTARRLEANGTAWEWSQWRFECPRAFVICDPLEDPVGAALRPEGDFAAMIERVLQELHRGGGIVAALGHAVALIVDGELAPCSA